MRIALLSTLLCCSAFGQGVRTAPVPPDPLELVTGETQIPASPEQRASVVTMLERAAENHNLHIRNNAPYALNVSFTATASTIYGGGAGTLQESWVSGDNWRWAATLGNYMQVQLSSNGAVYSQNSAVMPMRVRTLRQAVFAPVQSWARRATIRTANVLWNGTPLTCILLSAGWNEQTPAVGRQWYETEYCVDPANSTLRIFSEAPGVYIAYDYANALKFHNHTLPGKISITENGNTVVEAQLTSIADADPANLGIYTPTAQMVTQGAALVMGPAERFPMVVFSVNAPAGLPVQPVIVHLTLDRQGQIQEYESLQSGGNAQQALSLIRSHKYVARPAPAGASPLLREAYVNVQFRPAQ